MDDKPKIDFDFEVVKIQSMADGSPRVVVGLMEGDLDKAMKLWAGKLNGMLFHAEITVVDGWGTFID